YCLHRNLACIFTSTATTATYPLSLHDALPISVDRRQQFQVEGDRPCARPARDAGGGQMPRIRPHEDEIECLAVVDRHRADDAVRSEEHTSELQSLTNLVCRLLLEK